MEEQVDFTVKKRSWVPGFRSGKWWKSIIALFGYGFIFIFFIYINDTVETSASNEKRYQQGIEKLQQKKWNDATVCFIVLWDKNYKDAKTLYNYGQAKLETNKRDYSMAELHMKEIPDTYDGPMKTEILQFKTKALYKAQNLTPAEIKEEERQQKQFIKQIIKDLGEGYQQNNTMPVKLEKPDLELIESHPVSDEYIRYVAGTIKNNTDNQYGYAQVEINLYDKSGAQIGSTMANTNNLEPGGTWKFKAVMLEDKATKYKIKDISGF